jgi:hypothetical protein
MQVVLKFDPGDNIWRAWARRHRRTPWAGQVGLAFKSRDAAVLWACKTFNVDVAAEDPREPPLFVFLEE